jgi:hypothetical protein
MSKVVREAGGLNQTERRKVRVSGVIGLAGRKLPDDASGNLGHFERMGQPSAVEIAVT